jgi:ribonuclease P protein component
MRATFPPGARVRKGFEYNRVFKRPQKAAGRHVVVLACRRDQQAVPRLGVIVPAKAVRAAVRRHQLKRWVRELFRTGMRARCGNHDVVVLFRADPPADGHRLLDDEISSLLPKALAAAPSAGRPRGERR